MAVRYTRAGLKQSSCSQLGSLRTLRLSQATANRLTSHPRWIAWCTKLFALRADGGPAVLDQAGLEQVKAVESNAYLGCFVIEVRQSR